MVQWINGGWLIFRWCYTTWFIGDDYSQWQEYLSESISLTGWERCIFMAHMARWNKKPLFFFSGDSDSKLLTHSWRGISVSMEDLLFLFFYLSYLSIFYPVDGPAKSCSTNLGWFFNPNKIMGCLPSTGDSDFAGPSTQDGPPPVMFVGL